MRASERELEGLRARLEGAEARAEPSSGSLAVFGHVSRLPSDFVDHVWLWLWFCLGSLRPSSPANGKYLLATQRAMVAMNKWLQSNGCTLNEPFAPSNLGICCQTGW